MHTSRMKLVHTISPSIEANKTPNPDFSLRSLNASGSVPLTLEVITVICNDYASRMLCLDTDSAYREEISIAVREEISVAVLTWKSTN